jgi:hypothetical protein
VWAVRGPADDSYQIKIAFYKKQGGQYRLSPMNIPPKGFCEAFNSGPYFAPDFAECSNFTLPLPCPFSNVRKLIRNLSFVYRSIQFQTVILTEGYRAKIPQGVLVALSSGDHAFGIEVTLNKVLVLETWYYFGLTKM